MVTCGSRSMDPRLIYAFEREIGAYIPQPHPCPLRHHGLLCATAWGTGRCQAARRGISCIRYHMYAWLKWTERQTGKRCGQDARIRGVLEDE